MKKTLSLLLPVALALGAITPSHAQPYQPEQLQLGVAMPLAADLGLNPSTTYNPRWFDGRAYVVQINVGTTGIGRYPAGSAVPEMTVQNATTPLEHRMLAPFPGAYRPVYMLAASGAKSGGVTTTLSRYDADGGNRVDAETPGGVSVESFDWVDDDTIICVNYGGGNRTKLYLMGVTADPFAVTANTRWSPNGYITTSATTRLRNVRVGDKYPGYAYYGDAGQNTAPVFYALNLATGAETPLGALGDLTGSGSYGLWTVVERGGYLYIQTTDNGIEVYSLTDATTLGAWVATYTKYDLDALTGYTGQYYGFDVNADATRLLLGCGQGKVFELGPPFLGIAKSEAGLVLTWPESVTSVVIQSAPQLPTADFADLDPQPIPEVSEKLNRAPLSADTGNAFFRLRKGP
ncbi:MAG TPA: hypothetical protein PKM73_09005 [Verrucomicrobiota bacterium]|nr:hypothetical protein [Verrucomicrobiota bacterium]HNU50081.1 hypothetical protein [Verrucomicrobiota bacterium]